MKGLRKSCVFLAVGCTCHLLWWCRLRCSILFQAGTWHPKKNALLGAASDWGAESTVKLSAQDRQWCHSLERKYTAKATHFPLWLCMFLFLWACHPGRSLGCVFSFALCDHFGLTLWFVLWNSLNLEGFGSPLHWGIQPSDEHRRQGNN